MCNHYEKNEDVVEWGLSAMEAKLNEEAARAMQEWKQHCYPNRPSAIITQVRGEREIFSARWGAWVNIKGKEKIVANSRGDSLLTFSTWKGAVRKRRCLIPASAYYEPGKGPVGAMGELRFHPVGCDRFFIAGIYGYDHDAADPSGGERWFSMVTTEPNDYAVQYHDRMPLALSEDDARIWIGDEPLPDDLLVLLLKGLPSDCLTHTEIPASPKPAKGKITKADLRRAADASQGDLFG